MAQQLGAVVDGQAAGSAEPELRRLQQRLGARRVVQDLSEAEQREFL